MQDVYRYLEETDTPEVQDFAAQAHAETQARFAESAHYQALRDDIAAQLRDERQIPFCQEHRARMYHFHQSAEYPKGVYRVC